MKLIAINCLRWIVLVITLDAIVIKTFIDLSIFKEWCYCVYKTLTCICCISFIDEVLSSIVCLSLKVQEQSSHIDAVKCCWTCLESTLTFKNKSIIFIVLSIVPTLSVDVSSILSCWTESNVNYFNFAWIVIWIHLTIVYTNWNCPIELSICSVKH